TMNFTLITALLCWISVSVSEFHTVEVQPGEEVTLLLSNKPNATSICYMSNSDGNASYSDGFQNGKFNMTSNSTTLFLNIKPVDLSDSGLYFCGFPSNGNPVISIATHLKVQETSLSVILGAGTFLITAVTAMANLDSDDLKDAALSLQVETHVIYAASR
uniref:Immunoglobulin V-set domain-containing protein n=1 Tax=Lates calcarifer TaxID=8187 RepID=A0A4W6CW94_LATCA